MNGVTLTVKVNDKPLARHALSLAIEDGQLVVNNGNCGTILILR